jgi:hypothetical protein
MEMFGDLTIVKNAIRIAPAWQVGENDIDSMAIMHGDDPIIPHDLADVPVLGLLERRKRRPPESL